MKNTLKNILAVAAFGAFCAIPALSQAAVSLSSVSSQVSQHPNRAAAIAANAAENSPDQAAEIAAAALNGLGRHATPENVAAIIRAVLPYLKNSTDPCGQIAPVVLAGLEVLAENGKLDANAISEILEAINPYLPNHCVAIVRKAVNDAYPQYAQSTNTTDDSGNVVTNTPPLPATFLNGGGGGGGVSGPSVTPVQNQ